VNYLPILFLLFMASPIAAIPYFPSPIHWETRTPTEAGIDPDGLQKALACLEAASGENGVRQTVLIRDGYLVHHGEEAHLSHGVWSVSKVFTSTAAGLLIAEGRLGLETKAVEHAPFLAPHYPDVIIEHLLTMASGYDAEGKNRWGSSSRDWSTTPYNPAPPLFPPGTAFAYWDEAMMLQSYLLTKVLGEEMRSYLTGKVTNPIGLGGWSWWSADRLGKIGINNGGTGIEMNAFQLARFGLLYLRDGVWEGQRLLPARWIAEATRVQVPHNRPLADTDRKGSDGRGIYGYNWWIGGLPERGVRGIPSLPRGSYYASGHNHNMLFVIPAWDMVFVRMGLDGNPSAEKREVYNAFFETIGRALN
jgi:CubicO group peptidase (beta-lactamase class C family)